MRPASPSASSRRLFHSERFPSSSLRFWEAMFFCCSMSVWTSASACFWALMSSWYSLSTRCSPRARTRAAAPLPPGKAGLVRSCRSLSTSVRGGPRVDADDGPGVADERDVLLGRHDRALYVVEHLRGLESDHVAPPRGVERIGLQPLRLGGGDVDFLLR